MKTNRISAKNIVLDASTASSALLLMSCLLATVDTGLFAYSSLSKTFGFSMFALSLALFASVYSIAKKQRSLSGSGAWFILAWGVYVLCHGYAFGAEYYRVCYFISSLVFLLGLYACLRSRLLCLGRIEGCLLAVAAIHIVFMAAQAAGVAESASPYFKVTGANENPNTTAIYLTVCLPILIKRLRQRKHTAAYATFLGVAVLAVLALKCRTAYVGAAVMAAGWALCDSKMREWLTQLSLTTKMLGGIACLVIVSATCLFLYGIKKNSADGRVLVWKISAMMILERPQGYGYGLFERNYNLGQAEYFSNGRPSENECQNAAAVSMAYNDYLEQGVEGGLPGMAFLVAFYTIMAVKAIKRHMTGHAAVVSAFAAMSLFNFIYTAIQPWMMLLCYSADIMACSHERAESQGKLRQATTASVCVLACALLFCNLRLAYSQIKLNNIAETMGKGKNADARELEAIGRDIGTSELYWRIKGRALAKAEKHEEAAECFRKALDYTSSPGVMFGLYANYAMAGKPEKGLGYLVTMANMIPSNLHSRIYIMRHYHKQGDRSNALAMAKEITQIPLKVMSEEALAMQNEARRYITRYTTKQ